MFLFQISKEKPGVQQAAGVYRFSLESLNTLNMSLSPNMEDVVMNPRYLEKAVSWIKKNGKGHEDGTWSVEAGLLQPGNMKAKNSLYNWAAEQFPHGGAKKFCTDVLLLVKEADAIHKSEQDKGKSDFFRKT